MQFSEGLWQSNHGLELPNCGQVSQTWAHLLAALPHINIALSEFLGSFVIEHWPYFPGHTYVKSESFLVVFFKYSIILLPVDADHKLAQILIWVYVWLVAYHEIQIESWHDRWRDVDIPLQILSLVITTKQGIGRS